MLRTQKFVNRKL